ncbi:MAG: hypothetical protein RIF32_01830 [Leptospirales bacterium]|jgi:hypothetical protein
MKLSSKALSQKTSTGSSFPLRRGMSACLILSIWLFAPVPVAGEVLQLKDGTLLEGRIISQDQKRVVLKTATGQRVVNKTSIRRIVYDPGMGARLIADQERKAEAEREAARQKALEARRAKEAAELAKKQQREAEQDAEAREREARAARLKYAARVAEYRRRAAAEAERVAREEALKKEQAEQDPQKEEVAEQESEPDVRVDRWGALWRSALLPGWGQFYAGSPIAGTAYSGLFAFGAVNSYNLRRIAISSRNEYTSFTDTSFLIPLLPGAGIPAATVVYFETSRRSETYARNVKRQQQSVQFLGGIYLVQLVHAAFLSAEISTATLLQPDPAGDGGASFFADQAPIDDRDRFLGAGSGGLDSRLGFGYSLRF